MKQGWEYKKLGEVCEVVSGSTPKTNVPEYWGEGHYWVTPAELNDTIVYIDKTERQITDEALTKTKLRLLPVGTVLLSSRAPIGKVAITKTEMYCNQGFKNCICSDSIYNKYLFYFLRLKKEYLNSLGRGATFKEISKSIVESISIPIPPKSTQLSIVSELDKINELIRLKKEQLKDYDNLAQSIFYEMFGDPVENDKGFYTKRLDEVFPLITDGTHQTPTYTEDRENGYKFLSAKDVTSGSINWNNVKFIPAWLHDNLSKRLKPQKNDILLCKNGTTGICALVEDDDTFDIYVSLALLRPNNLHNPKYLTYAINSPATKRQFDDSLKGIGVPNLHLKEIRRTIIIIPPLPLQHLFAQRIEQIEHQKSEVTKAITDLETLLASRMQYWFE